MAASSTFDCARTRRRLRVRLAVCPSDIAAAQALRFAVFHGEKGACLSAQSRRLRLDMDAFDARCDHVIVEDMASGSAHIVGTYRLLRQPVAAAAGGFYSATEFDMAPLLAHAAATRANVLELGRSCVAREYRDSATIRALWHGVAAYLQAHDIGYLFGCASFDGVDPAQHEAGLTYLHHYHLAPPEVRARAIGAARVEADRLPIGGYDGTQAFRSLPPLIKGYLRVGASVGDGGWVDRDFNTIDVFMVMPVAAMAARYANRFSASPSQSRSERSAA